MATGHIRVGASILILGLVLAIAPVVAAQAPPGPRDPDRILRQLADADGDAYWQAVADLESLGKDALPVIELGLRRPEAKVRTACAKVAYAVFEQKKEAVVTLIAVLKERNPAAQMAAAEVLSTLVRDDYDYGDPDTLGEDILAILDATAEARVKIAICKALYSVSASTAATRELKELLNSTDPGIVEQAALALAEIENFEPALPVLERLAPMPNERGRLARMYLKQKRLIDYQERTQLPVATGSGKYKYGLLEEIMDLVFAQYVDSDKVKIEDLVEAAAHGIGNSLDRFSSYLAKKERLRLREGIEMKYGGIGAHVNMRGGWLTIERPVYGGPCDKLGLRPLDQIVEVEGESTKDRELADVVVNLKGEAGTQVRLKIYRRGWTESRDFVVTREALSIDTAKGAMLPGHVGYVQITSFGNTTAEELARVLATLKSGGMTSLIVDVRGNPGGYLKGACDVVDLFLEANKVIVTTRDRTGKVIDTLYTERPDRIDLPTIVMVDSGSASAAEIFAGCMRDHKRATLVGERSFGKGSVQHILPLKSTGDEAALRLTVHKYYLPGGTTPHKEKGNEAEGGIPPAIEVKKVKTDFWKDAEFARILDAGDLEKWWNKHWTAHQDKLRKLAEFDGFDPTAYPGFDEFYREERTKLEPAEIRQLLRSHVRRMVAYETKGEFLADYEEDVQLQRAILEAMKQAGGSPATVEEFKTFARAFDEVEKTGVGPHKDSGK